MRIGIDARFITSQPRRGIGNYSLNLVREIVKIDISVEYFLYIAEPDVEGILSNLPNVKIRQLWPSTYPLWENIALPIAVIEDHIDVLHCLGNTAPFFLPRRLHLVLSMMDVMFLQTGECLPKPISFYQKLGRLYRAFSVPFVALRAKNIITISEFSRQDILRFIAGVDSDKVSITHLSCDSIFNNSLSNESPTNSYIAEITRSPYIFCLGAEDPRKNTLRLIRSYLFLLKKGHISENLIISGYANFENSSSYQEVLRCGATDKVRFLKFVSNSDLRYLYRKAVVFVYPSLYEGFGIPLIEAFSVGCPVIASNVTSIPEVGSNAALYFDPLNEDEIAKTLLQVLNNVELREELKRKGLHRARQFSWPETARKTLAIYRKCLKEAIY
jgi:glycosyltransferase involved in cell wall biosynthesis